jgi:hypothetical protein
MHRQPPFFCNVRAGQMQSKIIIPSQVSNFEPQFALLSSASGVIETIVAKQNKRQELESYLTARARSDPGFQQRLLANPRAVIEAEIGLNFPDSVVIHVHEENLNELHIVLPVVFRLLTELEDEDLDGVVGGAGQPLPVNELPIPQLSWMKPS